MKNWGTGVNYCWNFEPSKLLLHFIEYLLDELNKKQTKIAVNSTIQYFEGRSWNKFLLKAWRFFVHPPQNWTEIEQKSSCNGQYQTFGLMNIHNMSKIWFANNKFNLLSWNKMYFSWFFKGFQLPETVSDCAINCIGY